MKYGPPIEWYRHMALDKTGAKTKPIKSFDYMDTQALSACRVTAPLPTPEFKRHRLGLLRLLGMQLAIS